MGRNAPNSPRTGAQNQRRADSGVCDSAWLDPFERDVLEIARCFFQAFAQPESHAWVAAFHKAEGLFQMPFGASIAHAILIAIDAFRVSRRNTFLFEPPGSPSAYLRLTDTERYFVGILHDIRRNDRASARIRALLLCEGADTANLLAAVERLAIITGDVSEPHFNQPA